MPKITHNQPTFGKKEEKAVLNVLKSVWVAQGYEVSAFENEFCNFLGLPTGHAVAVSSGTAALFISLNAINAKDKIVALPVYCCSALRNATAFSKSHALYLDNASGSPNINLSQLKTSNADLAIIPHMFGIPINLNSMNNINIIEDCAQALGASINGDPVGLQSTVSIFSFYATKLITSGGQGGMIVSKDKGLIDFVRDYREFDCRHDRKVRFNFQMTDLQAAVGRIQLQRLPQFLTRRAEIFQLYINAGLPLLDIQQGESCTPVRFRAILKTRKPQKLIKSLKKNGIIAIIPIEDWELLDSANKFPNAAELTKTTVSLPLYPSLSDSDINTIISIVKNI